MKFENGSFDWTLFHQMPIIGIIRNMASSDLPRVMEVFVEAGLHTVEITMNSPDAEFQIRQSVDQFGTRLNIGAGTVRNTVELDRALGAGATFIVTPNVDESVIARCNDRKIPIISGALTPTEIYRAHQAGADMIKVFPASAMGSSYIKNLNGPFDHIELIATGGIDVHNLSEYWNAGADGFGIGGALVDKKMIRERNWDGLEKHMHRFVQVIQKGKE